MTPAPPAVPTTSATAPMALLAGGVPLSLLLDLVLGPRSEELLAEERIRIAPLPRQPGPA